MDRNTILMEGKFLSAYGFGITYRFVKIITIEVSLRCWVKYHHTFNARHEADRSTNGIQNCGGMIVLAAN